jgi:PAS domain S-box-containing protein
MNRRSPHIHFRTRFFIGIAAILFFFSSVCALLIYRQGKSILEDAAYAKAQIVVASVEANQSYVRTVLRPKMNEILGPDAFVLQAMSTSYISRVVMDNFNQTLPEYRYRRVAIDARNPTSEANAEEIVKIRYFESNPDKTDWQGIVNSGDEAFFMCYRPVRFYASCLHCHGNPTDAPPALIETYGSKRGFKRREGQIAGIHAMGVPVDFALVQIRKTALSVFLGGLSFIVVLFVVIGFFFNKVVISDLRSLLEVFSAGLRQDEQALFTREMATQDEIEALKAVGKSMAHYLSQSRRQLEQNAESLECTVAERTRELKFSEQRLRKQVVQRNLELKALNTLAELTTRANCLSDVFPKVLKETLGLISARGAGLYLFQQESGSLELICHKNAPQLPEATDLDPAGGGSPQYAPGNHREDLTASLKEAARGRINFFQDREVGSGLNIPLLCRGQALGVITVAGLNCDEITADVVELLYSVGRQIGIAIESLQSMRKLMQSKELLQSVFDGITDMVVLMDKEFKIRMVNKAYIKRYGRNEKDVLGERCYLLHADDGWLHATCGMQKALKSKSPAMAEVVSKSGEIFLMHFYPVLNEQGEVESIVRYARDITDQRKIEQQIQRTERLASLGQLSAGIAHEINNPLGVILCYTSLLKHQLEGMDRCLSDVATIEKHAVGCKRIVSDLLKFARSESSTRQPASINRTIEEALAMVPRDFNHKSIDVQLDLSADLPLVCMDSAKMKQVFLNLFMNSEQAIEERGKIRVVTSKSADTGHVQVLFQDNGQGIAPENLKKIFDPFFTTKAPGQGTGLGLSVSYGIIRDHGGEIHAASDPGGWTQFAILLPESEAP